MKFFCGDPFLAEHAGTYRDRACAILKIIRYVLGCDPAARQELDLGERALDLLKIIRSETAGRKYLNHGRPGQPRFIDILRDKRSLENGREVLTLRNLLHYSYEEISATLGLSRSTVKSRITRARKNLRELLAQKYAGFERGTTPFFQWFESSRSSGHVDIAYG